MSRTDGFDTRPRALRNARDVRLTSARQRKRDRRFVPDAASAGRERVLAESRAQKALRRTGVLIQLRLLLREGVSPMAARKAAQGFRRAGFIVWRDGGSLLLIGEPNLALTFMDLAANARLLSTGLKRHLNRLLKSYERLRAVNRPGILTPVEDSLALILRVEAPG